MTYATLLRNTTGLFVIDVQDRLFLKVERSCEVMLMMEKVIKAFQILKLPIFVTEQYPKGMGKTIESLRILFDDDQKYFAKTTFSCVKNAEIKNAIMNSTVNHWILIGIEAHVCILQTAKDLLALGKEVVILNDAITSRSIYDFSTAIAEMRDCGARITSTETILFELLEDSQSPDFKNVMALIK